MKRVCFESCPRQIIAKRRAGKAFLANQVLSSYFQDYPVCLSAFKFSFFHPIPAADLRHKQVSSNLTPSLLLIAADLRHRSSYIRS